MLRKVSTPRRVARPQVDETPITRKVRAATVAASVAVANAQAAHANGEIDAAALQAAHDRLESAKSELRTNVKSLPARVVAGTNQRH